MPRVQHIVLGLRTYFTTRRGVPGHRPTPLYALSVSAFDAAIQLARRGRFLLSEALLIRDRGMTGQGTGKGTMLNWDEHTGNQQLAEVMERMQGAWKPLGRLLGLPT
jgi:hypothetical protein